MRYMMKDGSKRSKAYNSYVNHMIKFFLTCPDGLVLAGHSTADIQNWCAVQRVWCELSEGDQDMLRFIYSSHRPYKDSVEMYASLHGTTPDVIWRALMGLVQKFAQSRGLI